MSTFLSTILGNTIWQGEILKLILGKKDIARAIRLVKGEIKRVGNLEVELKDLVVYEQLTKPIGEYQLTSPHTSADKKLVAKRIPINAGSGVEFEIEKGSGSMREKAQLTPPITRDYPLL
jgi:DNA polymerase elongation subunit (family B)